MHRDCGTPSYSQVVVCPSTNGRGTWSPVSLFFGKKRPHFGWPGFDFKICRNFLWYLRIGSNISIMDTHLTLVVRRGFHFCLRASRRWYPWLPLNATVGWCSAMYFLAVTLIQRSLTFLPFARFSLNFSAKYWSSPGHFGAERTARHMFFKLSRTFSTIFALVAGYRHPALPLLRYLLNRTGRLAAKTKSATDSLGCFSE